MFFEAAAYEDCFENRKSFFEVMLRFVEKIGVCVTETMKTQLNCIGMYNFGESIGEYSRTAFFCIKIIFVLRVHLLSVKYTKLLFKSWAKDCE